MAASLSTPSPAEQPIAPTPRGAAPGTRPGGASPVGHAGTRVTITERDAWQGNGFLAAALVLALLIGGIWLMARSIDSEWVPGTALGGAAALAGLIIAGSITVIQPGRTIVVQLFGRYVGTARRTGLIWVMPFTTRRTVSVRVRNFETTRLKVNDLDGNPVEIAAIIVWQVADTARSTFAVEYVTDFVTVQAEAAVRHVARTYPYDGPDAVESLRGSTDVISDELAQEVAERITIAGVEVLEVRISHLAYAPEIAQAMLQRQQASAVVAARSRIVEGAVGMVQMALAELSRQGVVDLDEERRAAMVSNLLVVLCGEARATPVVNAGSLYA
jgi:regulator of protease activity HflC (stomatin/prohibitin superfamily)